MGSKKILVVDDEVHITHVLSLKLENAGFEVITAEDGKEALECIAEEIPDMVITGCYMPVMTGLELVQHLRADARTEHLPVIMLTGRGQTITSEGETPPKIDHVLSKPFSPREVLRCVENLLGARC